MDRPRSVTSGAMQIGILGMLGIIVAAFVALYPRQPGARAGAWSPTDATEIAIGVLLASLLAFVALAGLWRMRKWAVVLSLVLVTVFAVALSYDLNNRLLAALMPVLPLLNAVWLLPSWSRMSWGWSPLFGPVGGVRVDARH